MKTYKPFEAYVRLLQYLKPVLHIFIMGVIITAAAASLDGALGQFIKPLVNQGFEKADPAVLFYIPLLIIGYFLIRAILGFFSIYFLYLSGNFIMARLRRQAFSRFMGSRFVTIKDANIGGFLSLLNYNIAQVEDATTGSLRRFLIDIFLIISAVFSLINISLFLTALVIVIGPLMYFVVRSWSAKTRIEAGNVQDKLGEVIRHVEQSIQAISTIRSMSAYEKVLSQFDHLLNTTVKHQKRFTVATSTIHASLQFMVSIPLAVACGCIVWKYIDLTPGDFAAFFYTIGRIMQPVRALSLVISDFQKGVAAAISVFKVCDLPQEEHEGKDAFTMGDITLSDVQFSAGSHVLCKNLNIHFKRDKLHAVVGPSGVGKSTLLSIIAQLAPSDSGSIVVGGSDYATISLTEFRKNVAYLDQVPFVWDDTVYNNIAFPQTDALDLSLMEHIIDITSLKQWVHELPYHGETMLGHDLMPSGGQKKRIALARVLYQKPDIMLLDEPTSAVDELTGQAIMNYLQSLKKNRLIILIAHQKSVAQEADCVHYMTAGKIISGTHEELLKNDAYSAYWQMHDVHHSND